MVNAACPVGALYQNFPSNLSSTKSPRPLILALPNPPPEIVPLMVADSHSC